METLIGIALLGAVVFSACSSGEDDPAVAPSETVMAEAMPTETEATVGATAALEGASEPETADELRARASEAFGAFADGDWGAVWDRLDRAGQDLVSRDEYIRRLDTCPSTGVEIEVVQANDRGGDWSVVLSYGGSPVEMPAAYEDGRWVFPFTPEAAVNMSQDFDSFVASNC